MAVAAILSGLSGGRQQRSLREAGKYSTRRLGRTLLERRYYNSCIVISNSIY